MENPINPNPVKTVASLKVWHMVVIALLFGAVYLVISYVVNEFVVISHIVTESTGE